MWSLTRRFMDEGIMPNLKQLAAEGVSTESLPSIPVDTPTNWTTIATGAEPATHGIQSFTSHRAGERLEVGEREPTRNKHATTVQAEFFWVAAERQGLRSLVVNYPTGWPALSERQLMVGGLTPGGEPWRLAKARVYATAEPEASVLTLPTAQMRRVPLRLKPAEGWRGAIVSRLPALETTLHLEGDKKGDPLHVLVTSEKGGGYDRLTLAPEKDTTGALATLAEGQWTPWISRTCFGEPAVVRLKLVRLSPDARHLELYATDVFKATGWAYPAGLERELLGTAGPYVEGLECPYVPVDEELRPYGPINVAMPITLELARFQADWMAEAAAYLQRTRGWDVLFVHYHLIDAINHTFLGYLDSRFPFTDQALTRQAWEVYRESYRIVDELIGKMVEGCADDSTVVVVTSDHAALPCWRYVSVVQALQRANLLVYDWDGESRSFLVDLGKSRAVPYLDPQHVWVNLQGREPEGIVPPERYEQVREAIIDTLRQVRDPETGESPFSLVCRREDLGLRGRAEETVGDVLYFLKPGYTTWDGMLDSLRFQRLRPERLAQGLVSPSPLVTGHHTPYLPTARFGELANGAMTFFAGPGLRRGYVRQTPIRLRDIAPTLAYLLGIEGPMHAEGAVLWDLLDLRGTARARCP